MSHTTLFFTLKFLYHCLFTIDEHYHLGNTKNRGVSSLQKSVLKCLYEWKCPKVCFRQKCLKVSIWKCPKQLGKNLKKGPYESKIAHAHARMNDLITLKRGRLNWFRYPTHTIGTYLGRDVRRGVVIPIWKRQIHNVLPLKRPVPKAVMLPTTTVLQPLHKVFYSASTLLLLTNKQINTLKGTTSNNQTYMETIDIFLCQRSSL